MEDQDVPQYGHLRSKREDEFLIFSRLVRAHIANYTVPQYGDSPDDEVEHWTTDQCVKAIQKYTKRFESGKRGKIETLRDMAKIAHYACLTFWKMCPTHEECVKIKEGKV